jgi:Trypsin-like serine proteases, typically periplasmic, contain C-terminal PDZ domain
MSTTPSGENIPVPDDAAPSTDATSPDASARQAAPGGSEASPSYPPRPPLPAAQPAAAYGASFPSAPSAPTPPASWGHGYQHTQPTVPLGGGHGSGAAFGARQEPVAPSAQTAEHGRVGGGKIVAIMVAAALVGGAAGVGGAAASSSLFGAPGGTVVTAGPSSVTVNNADEVTQTTAIAAKVIPSVVTISASSGSSGGTGSGVVLSEDGYVVTNTHVVTLDGATGKASITVTTSEGKVFRASVVGTDPLYDLAVIKLEDASGLTPIEFADSSNLNVGDETVAVGAPLGLSNTVTTGIVSALNRSIQIASSAAPEEGDELEDGGESPFQFDFGQGPRQQSASSSISIAVIQTDAAINPGNSGGALVDGAGKLIGVNVAIASTGGSSSSQAGSIGVGFSIPSNIVKRITDELIADGQATHGLLGAMVGDAAVREGATTAGAYISEVTAGGAAAKAGLKPGDVVTSFAGLPITDATDLTAQVRALAGGETATIVYQRDGKTASAEVTLGTLDQ